MTPFQYRRGVLHAEGVRLDRLAEEIGTPCWVYSASTLEARYRGFAQALKGGALSGIDATICYALKANSNQAVIATFARLGAGADVVSAGEMQRALAAGIPASKIVFAGVGKTADEMAAALKAGIHQFNVESVSELRRLSAVATRLGRTAPIALRVNPDVDAKTHAKITTGKKENKFGIDIDQAHDVARLAAALPGIDLQSVGVHIGSQIIDIEPFAAAFARLGDLAGELIAAGHKIRELDFGGGLGVVYNGELTPAIGDQDGANTSYVAAVRGAFERLPNRGRGIKAVFEPGRWLVANAGLLLARVVYVKSGTAKRFVIVDAAMNDLIRPTLYESFHPIRPVREPAAAAPEAPVDVVGPVCESGDFLALDRPLPPLGEGDLVAIEAAGAYGAVMSSTYNTRPLAPEVLVRGARWAVVRPRQTVKALIGLDKLPSWLDRPRNRPTAKAVSPRRGRKTSRRSR